VPLFILLMQLIQFLQYIQKVNISKQVIIVYEIGNRLLINSGGSGYSATITFSFSFAVIPKIIQSFHSF
jgi:hypothetical protein